ncbi:hypothetical protein PVK64_00050 [Aliivibrio sp. S4TY2]|uniref:hypothetical protein n=1 Tax=unclassified Aliivibrio TaxID=2645654 RepID=UPI00237983E9|nr:MULTISPECIES: hypothetical protein [unclassified Aliivibrio]MDD9154578.1 hypothetical protein [Aliivibrio sp. S4TY2]MDD9159059.1 hypothetical protein [Aliivibrio sp. S4TY1]MDD9162581.1 hypothetical protein [Aliivibrio sp. S4MY2]MDD9167058.1 hypothetical protein [Aliivibrio sp. S4MY4]MDD9183658.1 hypothetical protein [Aliivibrio sp. S4MY3]
MLANIIISGITFIAIIAVIIFSVWSIIDTRRKYSYQTFIQERQQEHNDAKERFKKRTRLGKND